MRACTHAGRPPADHEKRGHVTEADSIVVDMTVRTWQGIDGEMDNVNQNATEDGDEDRANLALSIRDMGARAVPGDEWPPDDRVVSINLSRTAWAFVVDCINDSTPTYEELGDEESIALGHAALEASNRA